MSETEDCEAKKTHLEDSGSCVPSSKTYPCSSVVLRRAQPLVPTFSKLIQNADLNHPPPNWLRSSNLATPLLSSGRNPFNPLHVRTSTQEKDEGVSYYEPSSVVLASHYPEDVGHVDVVADAKLIKKLLKLPHCTSLISMAIHRVTNQTLLIDEFNAPLLLSRAAKANLEEVFQESPLSALMPRKKDPNSIHYRNMMSKFLYYSTQNEPNKTLMSGAHDTSRVTETPLFSSTSFERECIGEGKYSESNSLVVNSPCSVEQQQPGGDEEKGSHQGMPLKTDKRVQLGRQPEVFSHIEKQDAQCTPIELKLNTPTPSTYCQNKSLSCFSSQSPVKYEAGLSVQSSEQEPQCPRSENSKYHVDVSTQMSKLEDIVEDFKQHNNYIVADKISMQEVNLNPGLDHALFPVNTVPLRQATPSNVISLPAHSYSCSTDKFPEPLPSSSPLPYHLNVRWSVKNINMLLGSDLPIYGVDGHPAISLRLRDMKKPVTVLTGMDYWLDNLMCNVPELAMCFHVDGIIQRYDIIKTEDIPKLDENCQFSPEEVLDVVHNILDFLKANCTQEGHTYWLFRKKGEDVVKLYDLTSLNCFQEDEQEGQNPFAHSVAMLFYRVAHNMLKANDESLSSEDLAIAKLLLENCIKLICNKDRKITVSAYCLLSDLYLTKVPVEQEPHHGEHSSESDESSEAFPENDSKKICQNMSSPTSKVTTTIVTTAGHSKSFTASLLHESNHEFPTDANHPLPLTVRSSLDRARLALEQVSKALSYLSTSADNASSGENSVTFSSLTSQSWQLLSVSKLMEQAGIAYLLLAETALNLNKLGRALRYGKYSILCLTASSCIHYQTESDQLNQKQSSLPSSIFYAWQLCGDIHCLSTKLTESFSANLEEFQLEKPVDAPIMKVSQIINESAGCIGEKEEACLSLRTDLESSLLRSIDCYEFAAVVSRSLKFPKTYSLEDRIGNALNELGVYYMQVAARLDFKSESKRVERLWKSSYSYIIDGIAHFQSTSNVINQSLLYANLGKLMFSCAHSHGVGLTLTPVEASSDNGSAQLDVNRRRHSAMGELGEIENRQKYSHQEKLYYSKSVEYYVSAKQILKHRSVHPAIWTNLVVDLSKVYLSMGVLMFKHPPLSLSHQEVSQEVVDVLMKAFYNLEAELQQVEQQHPRYLEMCKVAGDCHFYLGNLFQWNLISASMTSQKLKQVRTLTEKHYTKARTFYKPVQHSFEILQLLMKKADYFQHCGQGRSQVKNLQSSLACLLDTEEHLNILLLSEVTSYPENILSLYDSLLHQLQEVLKQTLSAAMKRSEAVHLVSSYKAMYEQTLKLFQSQVLTPTGDSGKGHSLLQLLVKLNSINSEISKLTA